MKEEDLITLREKTLAVMSKLSLPQIVLKPKPSIPFNDWPMWAKALATRATPEDKGIGDVVARTIGPEASGAFKAFYEMTFGKPCGCNGRQKLWNTKYPLNSKAT